MARQQLGFLLKMIRCGYAIYLKEYLVGIVIINRPEMFWQLRHQGDLSPYNIYGGMDEAKKTGGAKRLILLRLWSLSFGNTAHG